MRVGFLALRGKEPVRPCTDVRAQSIHRLRRTARLRQP